jgi:hypothetical protein
MRGRAVTQRFRTWAPNLGKSQPPSRIEAVVPQKLAMSKQDCFATKVAEALAFYAYHLGA